MKQTRVCHIFSFIFLYMTVSWSDISEAFIQDYSMGFESQTRSGRLYQEINVPLPENMSQIVLNGHRQNLTTLDVHHSKRLVITSGVDGLIKIWDDEFTGRLIFTINHFSSTKFFQTKQTQSTAVDLSIPEVSIFGCPMGPDGRSDRIPREKSDGSSPRGTLSMSPNKSDRNGAVEHSARFRIDLTNVGPPELSQEREQKEIAIAYRLKERKQLYTDRTSQITRIGERPQKFFQNGIHKKLSEMTVFNEKSREWEEEKMREEAIERENKRRLAREFEERRLQETMRTKRDPKEQTYFERNPNEYSPRNTRPTVPRLLPQEVDRTFIGSSRRSPRRQAMGQGIELSTRSGAATPSPTRFEPDDTFITAIDAEESPSQAAIQRAPLLPPLSTPRGNEMDIATTREKGLEQMESRIVQKLERTGLWKPFTLPHVHSQKLAAQTDAPADTPFQSSSVFNKIWVMGVVVLQESGYFVVLGTDKTITFYEPNQFQAKGQLNGFASAPQCACYVPSSDTAVGREVVVVGFEDGTVSAISLTKEAMQIVVDVSTEKGMSQFRHRLKIKDTTEKTHQIADHKFARPETPNANTHRNKNARMLEAKMALQSKLPLTPSKPSTPTPGTPHSGTRQMEGSLSHIGSAISVTTVTTASTPVRQGRSRLAVNEPDDEEGGSSDEAEHISIDSDSNSSGTIDTFQLIKTGTNNVFRKHSAHSSAHSKESRRESAHSKESRRGSAHAHIVQLATHNPTRPSSRSTPQRRLNHSATGSLFRLESLLPKTPAPLFPDIGSERLRNTHFALRAVDPMWTETVHFFPITNVIWASDLSVLISSSMDNTIKVISFDTLRILHTFHEHKKGVKGLAYSPALKMAVSGSLDNQAIVWNILTREMAALLKGHVAPVTCTAIDDISRLILTLSLDGTIRIWESDRFQCLSSVSAQDSTLGTPITFIHFHTLPTNRNLIVLGSKRPFAWRGVHQVDKPISKVSTVDIITVIFNAPFRLLYSIDEQSVVTIWSTVHACPLVKFSVSHSAPIASAIFDVSGRRLVTTAVNGEIKTWNSRTGKHIHTFSRHRYDEAKVRVPQRRIGETDASGRPDINATDEFVLHKIAPLSSIQVNRGYAVVGNRGWLSVIDNSQATGWSERVIHSAQSHKYSAHVVTCAFSPPYYVAAASDDGSFIVWNSDNGMQIVQLQTREMVEDIPDTTAGNSSRRREAEILKSSPITLCEFIPGKAGLIVTLNTTGVIQFWSVKHQCLVISFTTFRTTALRLNISPDLEKLGLVGADGIVQIFNFTTMLKAVNETLDKIAALQQSPPGRTSSLTSLSLQSGHVSGTSTPQRSRMPVQAASLFVEEQWVATEDMITGLVIVPITHRSDIRHLVCLSHANYLSLYSLDGGLIGDLTGSDVVRTSNLLNNLSETPSKFLFAPEPVPHDFFDSKAPHQSIGSKTGSQRGKMNQLLLDSSGDERDNEPTFRRQATRGLVNMRQHSSPELPQSPAHDHSLSPLPAIQHTQPAFSQDDEEGFRFTSDFPSDRFAINNADDHPQTARAKGELDIRKEQTRQLIAMRRQKITKTAHRQRLEHVNQIEKERAERVERRAKTSTELYHKPEKQNRSNQFVSYRRKAQMAQMKMNRDILLFGDERVKEREKERQELLRLYPTPLSEKRANLIRPKALWETARDLNLAQSSHALTDRSQRQHTVTLTSKNDSRDTRLTPLVTPRDVIQGTSPKQTQQMILHAQMNEGTLLKDRTEHYADTKWQKDGKPELRLLLPTKLIHPTMLPVIIFFVIGTSFDWHQHPVIALSDVFEEQLPNVEYTELPRVIRLNPGPLVRFEYQDSKQPITLDNIPFIRLIRTEQDASLSFNYVTPLLADSLTAPFIECVGAETFQMEGLTLSSSHLNSASFVSAKDSALTLRWIKIQLLKSTVDGAFLHLDSCSLTSDYDTGNLSSGVRGGLVYCQNSTVEFEDLKSNSCSAKQGGFLFSKECNTTIFDAVFTNCEAEEGGIACIVSSYLRLTSNSFVSNSAKRGGVFWIDFGDQSTSSVYSLSNSNYTSNTARDEDENGVDSGKGGAIYVKGTTTAKTPFSTSGHYEGNTAAVGNDVFVEEAVLGEIGPDLLSNGYAESYSRFPHLVIENYDGDEDEITRISNLVPYPSIRVSKSGKDDPACRWSNTYCLTIQYALQHLKSPLLNGSMFQRECVQYNDSMTTEPVELEKHDLIYVSYSSSSTSVYSLSLSAAYDTKEGIMFTITDESRLTAVRVKFLLKSSHQVVTVNSKDGRLAMQNCFVLIESDLTTSKSPINSVGSSLALNNVSFAPTLTASISTLSAPLVHYAPTPSAGKELGSGSCDITNCTLTNLTFPKTTMFVIETSGQVSFLLQPIYRVTTDLEHGKFISLKGQSFKQQIQPSLWHSNPSTSDLPYFIGEDVSMDEDDKWRTGSLVYWLISPSIEIFIGSVENAVDHPNCGSSTFQCTTLDSAFKSAGLNDLSTLSLSTSTSLSSELSAKSLWVIKSSSATKQEIEFDKTGSIEVASSGSKLSFESIVFTVAPTCQSATLIVIEEGEISFSSSGTLTLTDTLIQHIAFSHATLGSAICLHLGATISSSGTKPITDISSQAAGSHVLVLSSTELESSSIESIATQFTTWGPTLTTNGARFSKAQIDEFVEIDTGRVDELIYHWHPYEGITMFVDSEGRDHPKCGLSALPCSSLSANVENVGDGEAIVVCSALTETTGFIATKDLSVKTSDDTKQTLSVSSSTTFTSRSSSLAFTNLKFVPLTSNPSQNVEPLGRTDSLFVVESGSIELTDCSLSSFVIANKPLITHMSGSLTLESCEISSITRSSGNGTVLDTKMEDITSISLNEVRMFDKCLRS
ncbi:hypothetical protein BLNAU_20392 [Blattamonas nauphoetae]|uniref:Guanine nucleotide-binding protein subunit beta-like protein n=1 Tax=Blattamonas nauphoetae TaxID=2049346 RepID=A0ABQ9WYW3_9EUKA|nr:hypothetical protein BLNAU_20392 [Blattamonas nauphoetae]